MAITLVVGRPFVIGQPLTIGHPIITGHANQPIVPVPPLPPSTSTAGECCHREAFFAPVYLAVRGGVRGRVRGGVRGRVRGGVRGRVVRVDMLADQPDKGFVGRESDFGHGPSLLEPDVLGLDAQLRFQSYRILAVAAACDWSLDVSRVCVLGARTLTQIQ